MARLLTETADYNEGGSWGKMSDGWPSIKEKAYDVYVFANCVETSAPYGSYVLMDGRSDNPYLRVHDDFIEKLRAEFKAAGEPTAETSVAAREKSKKDHAPKWW